MTAKEALNLTLEMLEKAYNKNENFSGFYNFKTNEKITINDISQYITKALTELEELKAIQIKIKDILALNYSYQEIGIKIERLFRDDGK